MRTPRSPRGFLSITQLQEIEKRIIDDANAGHDDAAWAGLQSLMAAQQRQEFVALCVVSLVGAGHFSTDQSLGVLTEVYDAHQQSESVLGPLGEALDEARDLDFLNAPPPASPLFRNVVARLAEFAARGKETEREVDLLKGLFTAARMMGRQRDELVDSSGRRLIELEPDESSHHYNYGLFLKTRGRFREGMIANQTAEALIAGRPEAYEWNLGICATGAGEGTVALEVWKRLEQEIEMGRFGLPDGGYPECKVRLAERPLAERGADSDDPGLEESIWVERLSPCHGIIRSILCQDLGVDYGDVILFDGAPITEHTYGGQRVLVFPHLATLHRNHYQLFDFAGTQETAKQIHNADVDLEGDAVIYSHTENIIKLCASCWQDPDLDHNQHQMVDEHIVIGRIAAAPGVDAGELLRQLDAAMAMRAPCRIFVPDLSEAAGLAERAAVERRRFGMLTNKITQ